MALFARMKDPVDGHAQVISASALPDAGSMSARCKMHLVIRAPGIEPSPQEITQIVRTKRWPIPGAQLPVTVDRSDPSRLKIHWDRVPTREETAHRRATQAATDDLGSPPVPPEAQAIIDQLGLGGASIVQGGASDGGGPSLAGTDRVGQLERLAALRREGMLSDAEYEAEKARILGS